MEVVRGARLSTFIARPQSNPAAPEYAKYNDGSTDRLRGLRGYLNPKRVCRRFSRSARIRKSLATREDSVFAESTVVGRSTKPTQLPTAWSDIRFATGSIAIEILV